jgi:hypothetical protein
VNHPFDLLQSNLLDILYELRNSNIRLIVGGGYGLYLKRKLIEETNARTLFSFIPPARSTDDLDFFLETQILVDLEKAKAVREAVQALHFVVKAGGENFQFIKHFDYEGQSYQVRFDFLTKKPSEPSEIELLEMQDIRVKNKKKGGIHAHRTDEAIAVEDNPIAVKLEGLRTTGEEYKDTIYLPQSYAYLIMKLFAFRDWETKKKDAGYSRKHALDIYTIVAMMTEKELALAEASSQKYGLTTVAQETALIVNEFFSKNTALGNIRLREHPTFTNNADTAEYISVLTDLFPI